MLTLVALLPLCLASPQANEPAAKYRLDGREKFITRAELAREVAGRHRRSEDGQAALDFLVDVELIDMEAEAAGVAPTRKEVSDEIAGYENMLKQAGQSLDSQLAERGMSRGEFDSFVRLKLAQERLVAKQLRLSDPKRVSDTQRELWLRDARRRHSIELDPTKLPAGVVARIDDQSFGLERLGRLLINNLEEAGKLKFVRRLVLRDVLAFEARQAGIELTADDTQRELARRRRKIEANPAYRGVSFASWLKSSQGLTPEELSSSPAFVATLRHRMLTAKAWPQEKLEAEIAADRDTVLRRHGEVRSASVLLIRALEEPNELIKRTFEAAKTEIESIRKRIDDGVPFDKLARLHSEDPYSKVRGGSIGSFHREGSSVPDPIVEAAFGLNALAVSPPVRVEHGWVLVQTTKIEPAPGPAELLESLREEKAEALLEELVQRSNIEILQ